MCPGHQCSEACGHPVVDTRYRAVGSGTHIGSGVMNRAASHTHESVCCGETRHKLQQGGGGYRDIIVSVTRDSLSITRRLAKCLQQQNMWRADTQSSVMSVYRLLGVLCALIIETFLT